MQFIVLEPVKVAGRVTKPGEVFDDTNLDPAFIEGLLVAELVAVYEDDQHQDPADPAAPKKSTRAPKKSTKT